VVHSIESDWFGEAAELEAQQQVWALATGVKATAPRVAAAVQQQLRSLGELRGAAAKAEECFERKRQAMQERNHYLHKVESLRREFEERDSQGRGFTKEQLHRLSRNQEKLAYAEADLTEASNQSKRVVEDQLKRDRRSLLAALHGLAQAACCGWLISTGAVVCKALQAASAQAPPEAPSGRPQGPAVLVLPDAMAEEDLEPPERFDPARPFGDLPQRPSATLAEEVLGPSESHGFAVEEVSSHAVAGATSDSSSAPPPHSGYSISPRRPARAPSADSDELRAAFG